MALLSAAIVAARNAQADRDDELAVAIWRRFAEVINAGGGA